MRLLALLFSLPSIALDSWVLILLKTKGLITRFPWFFLCMLYSALSSGVRLATSGNDRLYFFVFWYTEPLGFILSLAAIWESFLGIFRIFLKVRWIRWTVFGAAGAALSYSLLRAFFLAPLGANRTIGLILAVFLTSQFLIVAVGILFFVLSWLFEVPFDQKESDIVAGFGVASIGIICTLTIRSVFGTKLGSIAQYAAGMSYLLAAFIWIKGLLRPEPLQPVNHRMTPEQMLIELDHYMRILKQLLKGKR